ncbi:transcription initiation factor RRN3 [Anopheles darlingi]|uniref:Transcription initiation factor RRN3 n=1 Tax=Anopheles darlingi TaxID=43151 RepID=W5JSQ5_ANODA|nr:RNA polymerase I-specific transcription initiation factor RRN3 [Anopheles darlingi]ETN66338.1 transcription initiation factor RRN3 [Anopheles darlingi]
MSATSEKPRLSSILKSPSPQQDGKSATRNKVRFVALSIESALQDVVDNNRLATYDELLQKLKEEEIDDVQFMELFIDAKRSVPLMKTYFTLLVDQLLSMRWLDRSGECVEAYKNFVIELSIVHKNFCPMTITKLVKLFIPTPAARNQWNVGVPEDGQRLQLAAVHDLIMRLTNVIPMIFDVVLTQLRKNFPYHKKPTYEVTGYLYNVLQVTEYASIYCDELLDIVFHQLLQLDVNVPRSDIEATEYPDEDMIFDMAINGEEEGKDEGERTSMKHPLAETLDCFMHIMFNFIERSIKDEGGQADRLFKIMFKQFETHVLPTHNTDHVQFLLFYFCSFKLSYAEHFISSLWKNVSNPNISPTVRQASVGYIASMLARAKFVPLSFLKTMLQELSQWVHGYIQRSDSMHHNQTLKAHLVFYSVCQAIFYVVAFRSKHLTANAKNLSFLQSLQLSSIVTCHLNPLRVCLPTVATAFAGVTRSYQLAYCHTILERNARRKLATVYSNSSAQTPEDCLDTFFPFDPYMLIKSGQRIEPLYLQYQVHEVDEEHGIAGGEYVATTHGSGSNIVSGRKRYDSNTDDIDDFIPESKRRKHTAASHGMDMNGEFTYSYGVSPGFHS